MEQDVSGGGFEVLALGGDGIGPEVVDAALAVLEALVAASDLEVSVQRDLLHGAAYERYGTFCREDTVAAAKAADAILVGAVGGVQWDDLVPNGTPAEKDGLVRLRQELDVYAGLRPARSWQPLESSTPFRREVIAGADVMVLREMCGGIYFGEPRGIEALPGGGFRGFDSNDYRSDEIERIAHAGFELARRRDGRLTSIDKANVMESGVLWRRTVQALGDEHYPDVALNHLYADNAMYQLARDPGAFDVILADNLFGDIASDLAGTYAASLGMLPSASLCGLAPAGERNRAGVYEPVHGTAPDIAGQGIANPLGTILSVAMMCEYAFARADLASAVEAAVESVLAAGVMTPDLGGECGTGQVTAAVIEALHV